MPALDEVAAEFRNQGDEIERSAIDNANGIHEPLLPVSVDAFRPFHYQVSSVGRRADVQRQDGARDRRL